jgi:LysM repeat protein
LSNDNETSTVISARQLPSPPQQCSGQLYTVRASDTLFSIAQRFSVTLRQITAANPQITNPDIIFVGQVICIPAVTPTPTPTQHQHLHPLLLLDRTAFASSH